MIYVSYVVENEEDSDLAYTSSKFNRLSLI